MASWISIEGVEGSGKTTVAQSLGERLGFSVAPEFSDAVFGQALQHAVRDAPHFISSSAVGQSLVFLGDFIEVVESYVLPEIRRGRSVIGDRGPVMKYAYQVAVLETIVDTCQAKSAVDTILNLVSRPDLTVYLDCPIGAACDRLLARDGTCSVERRMFIERCDDLARERLGGSAKQILIVDATKSVNAIVGCIERSLPN